MQKFYCTGLVEEPEIISLLVSNVAKLKKTFHFQDVIATCSTARTQKVKS